MGLPNLRCESLVLAALARLTDSHFRVVAHVRGGAAAVALDVLQVVSKVALGWVDASLYDE